MGSGIYNEGLSLIPHEGICYTSVVDGLSYYVNFLEIFSWNDSQGGHLIKLGNTNTQFIIFFNIYWMSDY